MVADCLLRYAAASLVGSIALQGTPQIEAMGGPKLIKPLVWMLRNSGKELKYAAMRALHALSIDDSCCTLHCQGKMALGGEL